MMNEKILNVCWYENVGDVLDVFLYRIIMEVNCNSKFYFCREDFEEVKGLLYKEMDKYNVSYVNDEKLRGIWNMYFDNVENGGM